jgi:hypothetical protein
VLRKKLTVLLTVALIALLMMVASATPGMAAAKKYCVYYRGWHFISAKQFHKGNYKAYPARNCRGNAPPGFAYSASASASASVPSYFGSTSSASASASATASATATPSALASTGGSALALPLTLVASVGLVGFGIVALRTVLGRGGASS